MRIFKIFLKFKINCLEVKRSELNGLDSRTTKLTTARTVTCTVITVTLHTASQMLLISKLSHGLEKKAIYLTISYFQPNYIKLMNNYH